MEVTNIFKGHFNELLGNNKDISEYRMDICKKCPLFKDVFGGVCNPNLFMHPETRDVSFKNKPGYLRGCGCRLKAKTTILTAECPCKQW